MIPLSPDGRTYLHAGAGHPVPPPYHRRWLLPLILGPRPRRWAALTYASLVLTPLAAWGYFGTMGLAGRERIFAAALLSVLPGVWRCSLRFPVLLDAPSFALALLLATAARGIETSAAAWPVAPLFALGFVGVALLGGATRETVPIFAACWAWSPWPLVGLLAAGWWRKPAPLYERAPEWLTHPTRAAVKLRLALGLDASLYVRPFGAALAGLVGMPTPQVFVTCGLAVAQLAMAQDTIRLLAWAAPVLVLGAAKALPFALWPLAILVTLVQRDDRV